MQSRVTRPAKKPIFLTKLEWQAFIRWQDEYDTYNTPLPKGEWLDLNKWLEDYVLVEDDFEYVARDIIPSNSVASTTHVTGV